MSEYIGKHKDVIEWLEDWDRVEGEFRRVANGMDTQYIRAMIQLISDAGSICSDVTEKTQVDDEYYVFPCACMDYVGYPLSVPEPTDDQLNDWIFNTISPNLYSMSEASPRYDPDWESLVRRNAQWRMDLNYRNTVVAVIRPSDNEQGS